MPRPVPDAMDSRCPGAGNAGGKRTLHVPEVPGRAAEAAHHRAVGHERAAQPRAGRHAQAALHAAGRSPASLAEGVGVHVAHDGNRQRRRFAQARGNGLTRPAGHEVVREGDGAGEGVDAAGRAHAHAERRLVAGGDQLQRQAHDVIEHRVAAPRRVGGNGALVQDGG